MGDIQSGWGTANAILGINNHPNSINNHANSINNDEKMLTTMQIRSILIKFDDYCRLYALLFD